MSTFSAPSHFHLDDGRDTLRAASASLTQKDRPLKDQTFCTVCAEILWAAAQLFFPITKGGGIGDRQRNTIGMYRASAL
jgi:hypothetical protein